MRNQFGFLTSSTPIEYYATDSETFARLDWPSCYKSLRLYHSLAGFRVPALPVARDLGGSSIGYIQQVLNRFVVFIRALHNPAQGSAIALALMAHPDRSELGAEVGCYVLCRVASDSVSAALGDVERLADRVLQAFPTESLFNYDMPIRLTKEELKQVTLQAALDNEINLVELRKFEEPLEFNRPTERYVDVGLDYIAHPYWADTQLDPWLTLIEILAEQPLPTLVLLTLEPAQLVEGHSIAALAEGYRLITEEASRKSDLLDQAARTTSDGPAVRSMLQSLSLARAYRAQGLTDHMAIRAKRGNYAYQQILAWHDQLFLMRTVIASCGRVPDVLVQSVRAALSSPSPDVRDASLGWVRPSVVYPNEGSERAYALQNLRWLGQVDWGDSLSDPNLRRRRYFVTAREAVGLFHLPLMPQVGQTTALSTASVPFVIPPEVASKRRFAADEPLISMGYLYQRERWLHPDEVGAAKSLTFRVRLTDLEKPSLLVGAPGSGKSNLAVYLLLQLWEQKVPFLVLDPSNGQEYRYLLASPLFRDSLVLYTLGDEEGLPFRFNPFAVPPGVTVRGHITRLLACFKAAYEMWDPLPAIYESALTRLYVSARYEWHLDKRVTEQEAAERPFPTLADFANAVAAELEENVLSEYGRGTEAAGILTGASKIRVNSILNNLGHVLNVRDMDPMFFQRLLLGPVVIELGALGDPTGIALVMAFLITQLAGHIEFAHRSGARAQHPHMLLIEEAHRLLSAETTSAASPNQGNARGKSAEELNTLLAEVRKFRQGIMILDQRPSSLVGGVLDNALVNIMCRLNDRAGFEHLRNVLNLSPTQERYVRTRMSPGDAVLLDAISGTPVLVRAENVIDQLRQNRLSPERELNQITRNAEKSQLLPPTGDTLLRDSSRLAGGFSDQTSQLGLVSWVDWDVTADDDLKRKVSQAISAEDWQNARRQIRTWIMQNRQPANQMLENIIFAGIANVVTSGQPEDVIVAFREHPA